MISCFQLRPYDSPVTSSLVVGVHWKKAFGLQFIQSFPSGMESFSIIFNIIFVRATVEVQLTSEDVSEKQEWRCSRGYDTMVLEGSFCIVVKLMAFFSQHPAQLVSQTSINHRNQHFKFVSSQVDVLPFPQRRHSILAVRRALQVNRNVSVFQSRKVSIENFPRPWVQGISQIKPFLSSS